MTAALGTEPAAPAASLCVDPGIDRVLNHKKSVRFDSVHVKVKRGKILFREAYVRSKRINKSKKIMSVKTRAWSAVGAGGPAVRTVVLSGSRRVTLVVTVTFFH